jgi:hypothetical protein
MVTVAPPVNTNVQLPLGNGDVEFSIFHHGFHFIGLKFLIFERDQNAAEKS